MAKLPTLAIDVTDGLREQLALAARLMGMSMSEYIRFSLLRQMMADLRELPARHLILRPGAVVYTSPAPGIYVPAVRGLGGERVWMLGNVTDMPSSLDAGGGLGYLCDVTRGDVRGGVEGRGVFVRSDDVGAPERSLTSPVPRPQRSEADA